MGPHVIALVAAATGAAVRVGRSASGLDVPSAASAAHALAAGLVVNIVPTTRSERYLLRIGLVAGAGDALVSLGGGTARMRAWAHGLALVSFWAYLHHAMNPSSPSATTPE